MKIIWLILLSQILLACASKERIKSPYYWKVSKNDQTFYFFGTMHSGLTLKDFPKRIKHDLVSSELIAVETTAETLKDTIEQMKVWLLEAYAKDKEHYPDLKKEFSQEAWKRLSYTLHSKEGIRYVRDLGINHPMTEIHPALVYQMVSHFFKEGERKAFDPAIFEGGGRWHQLSIQQASESVIDSEIESLAKSHNIELVGLDNAGQAVAAAFGGKSNPFILSLEYIFNREKTLKKSFDDLKRLEKIYRSGNEAKLLSFAADADEENLLINRNKNWFDGLVQLENKKIFVAVGALHLVGENSLLTFFKERGYEVKRISFIKNPQGE
jgi:uncharacterized protein YbaP (TraB family)